MVSIRRKILDKGVIVKEQLLRVLQKHEDRITTLEQGGSATLTLADISDATLVEAVITYEDESTETVLIVTQTPVDSEGE